MRASRQAGNNRPFGNETPCRIDVSPKNRALVHEGLNSEEGSSFLAVSVRAFASALFALLRGS
jgi:hypothetical protein